MKRRTVISFILAILCVSCTEEEKSFFGEISKDEISFNGAGNSSVQLSFKTNSQWKAVSSEEWCRVFPNSGEGSISRTHVVGVVCDDNTGKAPRECTLHFMSGQIVREVTVRQDYITGLCLDVFEYEVGAEACECVVELWKDDIDVTVEIPQNAGWIKHVSTKSMTPGIIVLSISENVGYVREATITLSGKSKKESVVIRQKSGAVVIPDKTLLSICLRAYDTDKNGYISKTEALAATKMVIPNSVSVLDGLEYFSNLEDITLQSLDCKSFDFSRFPKLVSLVLTSPVEVVDLGKNVKLETLNIDNKHKKLLLTDNAALTTINYKGVIDEVDGSGCVDLKSMMLFQTYWSAGTLDLSAFGGAFDLDIYKCNCPSIVAIGSGVKLFSTRLRPTPSYLDCLKAIKLEDCPNLETIDLHEVYNMEDLCCRNNPSLETISIQYAQLKKVQLSELPNLKNLILFSCGLTMLDIRGLPRLKTLNCNANANLEYVYCDVMPEEVIINNSNTQFVLPD